ISTIATDSLSLHDALPIYAKFVKVTGRASYYRTLSEELDLVGLLSVGAGHVEAYDGELRVFDQFESNTQMIRGFDYNGIGPYQRSEEHTSELQSRENLVCR